MALTGKARIRYGSTVFLCGICMMTGLLVGGTTITTYLAVISEDFGVPRSALTMYFTVCCIVAFLINMFMVQIMNRLALKKILMIGMWGTTIMVLVVSLIHSLPLLYLGGITEGISMSFLGMVPLSIVIKNWFRDGRGVVIGIVTSFSSIGGAILLPVLGYFVDNIGWRSGFRMMSILSAVLAVLVTLFLHTEPARCGMQPYQKNSAEAGDTSERITEAAEKADAGENASVDGEKAQALPGKTDGRSRSEAVRKRDRQNRVAIIIMSLCYTTGMLVVCTNISSVVASKGFSMAFATGTAAGIYSLVNFVGKIGMGRLSDHGYTKQMLVIWYVACIPAGLFFLIYNGTWIPAGIVGSCLIGFVGGIFTVPVPLICVRLFRDPESYNTAISRSLAVSALAMAFGGPFFHGVYDLTGSYRFSLYYVLVLNVIAVLILFALLKKNRDAF